MAGVVTAVIGSSSVVGLPEQQKEKSKVQHQGHDYEVYNDFADMTGLAPALQHGVDFILAAANAFTRSLDYRCRSPLLSASRYLNAIAFTANINYFIKGDWRHDTAQGRTVGFTGVGSEFAFVCGGVAGMVGLGCTIFGGAAVTWYATSTAICVVAHLLGMIRDIYKEYRQPILQITSQAHHIAAAWSGIFQCIVGTVVKPHLLVVGGILGMMSQSMGLWQVYHRDILSKRAEKSVEAQ